MMKECKLTTFDNPFDPFDVNQFTSWLLYDNEKGYDCCGKLDRFLNLSDDLTEKEKEEEIERAIDTIIALDFTHVYKKLTRIIHEEEDDE